MAPPRQARWGPMERVVAAVIMRTGQPLRFGPIAMNSYLFVRLPTTIAIGLVLSGCGWFPSNAAKSGRTTSMIGEPCLVRVHEGKVPLAQGGNPSIPAEEPSPAEGFRFIAVGFPIGSKPTLVIEDYELLDRKNDPQIPFAAGGEGPEAPRFFSDTETFAETGTLTKGT